MSVASCDKSISEISVVSSNDLCNVVLAFIKAHRLKGDHVSLQQALIENFSVAEISDALQLLWNHSRPDLEACGLSFHQRRGSQKSSLIDMVIADLLSAFNKLDDVDLIPPIFCEAVDLLKMPPLVTDTPMAIVNESNFRIKDLQSNVQASSVRLGEIQSNLNALSKVFPTQSPSFKEFNDSLDARIQEIHNSLNARLSSLSNLSADVSSLKSQVSSLSLNKSSGPIPNSSPCRMTYKVDRSANLVFFGIPENTLTATRALVDEICEYLSGRQVTIRDLFRLGKRAQSGGDHGQARPRPVLVKLSTVWDRRLILISKTKLKDFRLGKIFVHPDLSPEDRAKRTRVNFSPTHTKNAVPSSSVTANSVSPIKSVSNTSVIEGDEGPVEGTDCYNDD